MNQATDRLSRPLLQAFFITAVLFLGGMFLLTPRFLINDDFWALSLSKGVGLTTHPEPRLLFNNVVLGHALNTAFNAFPSFNWYAGYLLLALFSCTTALFYLLLSRGGAFSAFWGVLFFAYLHVHFLTRLNYTIATLALFTTGVLLVSLAEGRRVVAWAGVAFLGAAFLTRPYAYFFGLLLTTPYLIDRWTRKPPQRVLLIPFACLAMTILAAVIINHRAYSSSPSWKHFHEEYFPQADLRERTFKSPEAMTDAMEKAHWTQNDLALFSSWYFLDEERYGLTAIKELLGATQRFHPYWRENFAKFFGYPVVPGALLFWAAVILLMRGVPRTRSLAMGLWTLCVFVGMSLFARLPERLFLPALAFTITVAILYEAEERALTPSRGPFPSRWREALPRISALLLVLSGLLLILPIHRTLEKWDRYSALQIQRSVRDLSPRDDQLFVLWDSRFPYEMWPAFDDFETFRDFHILSLAALQRAPFQKELLERFGVQNLFRDMIDRPDIFLICHPSDGILYMQYLEEHFGLKAKAEKTFEGYFYRVYRIKSVTNHRPRLPVPSMSINKDLERQR